MVDLEERVMAEEGIEVVEEDSEVGADTEQCIWYIVVNPPPLP